MESQDSTDQAAEHAMAETRLRDLLSCGHEWVFTLSQVPGTTCDLECPGTGLQSRLEPGLPQGEPFMSCSACDIDVCARCLGPKRLLAQQKATGWTEAHYLAWKGELEPDQGSSEPDRLGWTPLHWSCFSNRADKGSYAQTDWFRGDDCGQTPFSVLCRNARSLEFLESCLDNLLLVESGGGLGVKDDLKDDIVSQACLNGYPELLDALLSHQIAQILNLKQYVNVKDASGFAPIHQAVLFNDLELAKVLVKHGADPNQLSEDGYTALVLALQDEHEEQCETKVMVEIVSLLLENGAGCELGIVETNKNMTPLLLAVAEGYEKISKKLLEHGADIHATDSSGAGVILYAIAALPSDESASGNRIKNPLRMCRLLFGFCNTVEDKLRLVNCTDDDGNSSLRVACEESARDVVSELLSLNDGKGVDVNCARISDGITPLHTACRLGHSNIVNQLIKYGADVDAKDSPASGECTPLHYAVRFCGKETVSIVNTLIVNKADVNSSSSTEGFSPLHTAAVLCDIDTVRLLIEAGSDVNAKDGDGDTPLHNACGKTENGAERLQIVKLLLNSGAEINVANNKGFTPLAAAAAASNREIAGILVRAGAQEVSIKAPDESEAEPARKRSKNAE